MSIYHNLSLTTYVIYKLQSFRYNGLTSSLYNDTDEQHSSTNGLTFTFNQKHIIDKEDTGILHVFKKEILDQDYEQHTATDSIIGSLNLL